MAEADPVLATIRRLKRQGTPPVARPLGAVPPFDRRRWGIGLDDDTPPIVIPSGTWQKAVAGWPHDRWVAWRRRSGEIQAEGGNVQSADVIRAADHKAYLELLETEGG
jgi:hypothetical protein